MSPFNSPVSRPAHRDLAREEPADPVRGYLVGVRIEIIVAVPVSKVTRARSDSIAGPTLSSWSMSPIALIDRTPLRLRMRAS
jgi:hypothetical protein